MLYSITRLMIITGILTLLTAVAFWYAIFNSKNAIVPLFCPVH